INTDTQDLSNINSPSLTLQIGEKLTRGRGSGSNPEIGMKAALESTEMITDMLEGADMIFITAGMGGGTGTGSSQVVANHAASMGILTVAVVTKPFEFEGKHRMEVAEIGIKSLLESVDAIIVIPNEKLFEIDDEQIPLKDSYKKVDEVLLRAVRGISDIINTSGLQNVDFADVKTTMAEKGMTMMGTGESKGENRAEEAVNKALNSPLLDNVSIGGATGLLFNITTSSTLPLRRDELKIIAETINAEVSPEVKSKFGVVEDDNMGEMIRVTVIATGFENSGKKTAIKKTMREDELFPVTPTHISMPHRRASDNVSSRDFIRKETPANIPYQFEKPITPADLTDVNPGYINEGTFPGLTKKHNAENAEDELDIPTFQREKKSE
ncbi:MAG: cell division protein FtsZ, partial [Candidatus Aminicenantes bacterium]|nr:cell division protein FtsZ [Candidatus Aminicenantes bacterium]